jgi:hypothetical protein
VVSFDPLALRPRAGRSFEPGWEVGASALSPDRSRLALASCCRQARVAIVDLRRMRQTHAVDLSALGQTVDQLAWANQRRLFALLDRSRVAGLAAKRSEVLWAHALAGRVSAVKTRPQGLVVLLSPQRSMGPSYLVTLTNGGRVHSVRLARIPSGEDRAQGVALRPGLTLDGTQRRAFVVPPAGPVAEVDLSTLRVSYHAVSRRLSFLTRLRGSLDPAAEAKGPAGPTRIAQWAGHGLIAVSGSNGLSPTGLSLVDTRTWTMRELDAEASLFSVAGDLVLAYGPARSERGTWHGFGVNAYGLDGKRRFHLSGPGPVWSVSVFGRLAYVPFAGDHNELDGVLTRIVELPSGRVYRTVKHLPVLITATASPF